LIVGRSGSAIDWSIRSRMRAAQDPGAGSPETIVWGTTEVAFKRYPHRLLGQDTSELRDDL